MDILPLQGPLLPEAASLFIQNFKRLRRAVPVLPAGMEDPGRVEGKLRSLTETCPGVAAVEAGRLVGYMAWVTLENLRGTGQKAAYCREWGHAAVDGAKMAVYRALYRAAAGQWAQAGCRRHALTLLANDHEAEKAWFWNGFGLTVVDAVRPLAPLGGSLPDGFTLRKAAVAELDLLSALEQEHWQHYTRPPVFMVASAPGPDQIARFVSTPQNAYWLALCGDQPAGFIRFEKDVSGSAQIVSGDRTITVTGAYIRPEHRGRSLAVAILDAAFREYADQGLECCSVDFETFNPEAASFWPRYFEPVCLSVIRVPER